MKKAILTTKVGMTQIFNEDGVLTPVTVLQAGPCVVTQVKTVENDGYAAVQVGFGDIREKLVNKPMKGHFAKAGVAPKRFVREFRLEDAESYAVGQEIKADVFAAGDKVDATAKSKGKGFQGAIKRHGQSRGCLLYTSIFGTKTPSPSVLSRVLIIGDSLSSDMRGGVNAGIDRCWYRPSGETNTENIPVNYEIENLWQIWDVLAGSD